MLKILICALFLFFCPLNGQQSIQSPHGELQTVPAVDLNKFMGTWYEIARFRYPWDSFCAHNSHCVYTKTGEDSFSVDCQCQSGKTLAEVEKAKGSGHVIDKETNAKMRLSFNYFNTYRWVYSGDYWIIQLAEDYSYAVISEPTQKHVMVLSRTPRMAEETYQAILDKISLQLPNINLLNILRTLQD